ncbi:MAG: hypothetical protein LZ158_05385 [Thaumarchaeota archaeon]|nr:hypothetical protein [Candidatus Terraquivivens yellowstonensis]
MVPRDVLERDIIKHMSRQGLKFDGNGEDGVLRFVGNGSTYVVKVLDETDGRLELISAALQSAFWAAKGEKAYILVPKSMASTDELMVIRLHGIGLLLYGPHGIEELPPIIKHVRHEERKDDDKTPIELESMQRVLEKVERLERFIHRINDVDALASRLERLEAMYRELSNKLLVFEGMRGSHAGIAVPEMPSSKSNDISPGIELPSFMRDNPWLNILSGKG